MKANEIMSKASGALNKIGFGLKKRSPEILVAVGVVGTVVSAVMACKATTKINTILDETKEQLDKIHEYAGNPDVAEKYNAEDAKKDTAIVYGQAGVKLAKLYAPAVGLGILSISSILASNNILRKRNMAISAALAAATQDFKDYRNRVIERFGKKWIIRLDITLRPRKSRRLLRMRKARRKRSRRILKSPIRMPAVMRSISQGAILTGRKTLPMSRCSCVPSRISPTIN